MNRGKGFKSRGKPIKRTGRIKPRPQSAEDKAWSQDILARDPICRWPLGCNQPATDPHHIATRKRRPDLRRDRANGLGLCRSHHSWIDNNIAEATEMGLLSTETYEAAMKNARMQKRRNTDNATPPPS